MNKALVELIRKYNDKAIQMRQLGHDSTYYDNAAAQVLALAKQ